MLLNFYIPHCRFLVLSIFFFNFMITFIMIHNYVLIMDVHLICFIVILCNLGCGLTNPKVVFMACIMTLGITLSLTIYAMTTKTDFTMQGGAIFLIFAAIFLFAFFALFTQNKLVHTIVAILFAIIFGVYLIYDT